MIGQRDPENLAEDAEGGIESSSLSDTGGSLGETYLYNQPLIDYLNTDEQPEYLLRNLDHGLVLTSSGEVDKQSILNEEHKADGRQYLLATDQRLLYVVGEEDGDITREFEYKDITAVDWDRSLTEGILSFTDSNGRSYEYSTSGEADEVAGVADYIRRQAPAITPRESRSSDREWSRIKAGGLGFLFPPLGYVYTREYWIAFESLLQVGMYYVVIVLTFIGAAIGAAILRGVLLLLSEELLGSRVLRQGAEILPPIVLLLTALALVGLLLYAHGTLAREIYHDTIALNDGRREHKVSDDAMGRYKENE